MKKHVLWGLAVVYGLWNLWSPTSTQAQLFQNNNTSCEEKVVAGRFDPVSTPTDDAVSSSVTCGPFNDDTALGNPDFPDCATQVDPVPINLGSPAPMLDPTNTVLTNTGAHGQNCVNAGEPNAQFAPPEDLNNDSLVLFNTNMEPNRMGTIANGNLNGADFNDLAWIYARNIGGIQPGFPAQSIQTLHSLAGGGFGSGNFFPDGNPIFDSDQSPRELFPFPANYNETLNPPQPLDRSLLLLNCDGDGVDEAVASVFLVESGMPQQVGISVSQNSGSGLLDSPRTSFTPILSGEAFMGFEGSRVSIAKADFNGDGRMDIAAAVARTFSDNAVAFCWGVNDACGFACPQNLNDPDVINLDAAIGIGDAFPFSITSGDFDGNGLPEVAVSRCCKQKLAHYFFNNGMDPANWVSVPVTIDAMVPNETSEPFVIDTGRFSVEAFATDTDEVALTVQQIDPGENPSQDKVAVITTDGAGGLNPPLYLDYFIIPSILSNSLATADFDHCGGDDIISLAQNDTEVSSVVRRASLFLNTNETPIPTASIAPQIPTGEAIPISGSCTDLTNDQQTFSWSVITAPAGATVSFDNPSGTLLPGETDASTNVTVDTAGDYVFELTCVDFCELAAAVTVATTAILLTQGANLFNCSLGVHSLGGAPGILWFLFLLGPSLFIFLRLSRHRRRDP